MDTLDSVNGRVNPRRRGRPRTRPPRGPRYTAAEKRTEFRLHGPWYRFDYDHGPTVVTWANNDHVVIFKGTFADCQALLGALRS